MYLVCKSKKQHKQIGQVAVLHFFYAKVSQLIKYSQSLFSLVIYSLNEPLIPLSTAHSNLDYLINGYKVNMHIQSPDETAVAEPRPLSAY